jgi:hypothetical protein
MRGTLIPLDPLIPLSGILRRKRRENAARCDYVHDGENCTTIRAAIQLRIE